MFKQLAPRMASYRFSFYFVIAFSTCVLLADTALLWAWDVGGISVRTLAALHLGICLGFLLAPLYLRKLLTSMQKTMFAWIGVTVMLLGPVGAFGIALITLLYARYYRKSTPFDEWYKDLIPDQVTSQEERLVERLRSWQAEAERQQVPMPFADVLAEGSREEKITAITLMLRHYNASFAPAFREALNDADSAVRVQAASAITRIEENFLAENLSLEQRRAAQPGDNACLLKLAKHYDDHAAAGLCDTGSIAEYRRKAESAYRELHQNSPKDTGVLWSLGRLLIRAKNLKEAAVILEKALLLNNDTAKPSQRVWYWECLYEQQRYAELRQQVRQHFHEIPSQTLLPQNLIDSINLWNESLDVPRGAL